MCDEVVTEDCLYNLMHRPWWVPVVAQDLGPMRGGVHIGGGEGVAEANVDDVGPIISDAVVLLYHNWLLLLCLHLAATDLERYDF